MDNNIKTDYETTFKNSLSKNELIIKEDFLNKFIENGFPSKKLENWKFSDLNQIINKNIGKLSFYNDTTKVNKFDNSIQINSFEHNKIVFINGKLQEIDFKYQMH